MNMAWKGLGVVRAGKKLASEVKVKVVTGD